MRNMSMNSMKYLHRNDVVVYNAVVDLLNQQTNSQFTVMMAKNRIKSLILNLPMHHKLLNHLENILKNTTKPLRIAISDEIELYEDQLSMLATDPNDDEWDLIDVDIELAKKLYTKRTNFPKKVVDLVFNACVE